MMLYLSVSQGDASMACACADCAEASHRGQPFWLRLAKTGRKQTICQRVIERNSVGENRTARRRGHPAAQELLSCSVPRAPFKGYAARRKTDSQALRGNE
jgi:hypothetical protein